MFSMDKYFKHQSFVTIGHSDLNVFSLVLSLSTDHLDKPT